MTDLYVLGLLYMKPMSGYDIQMALQEIQIEQWGEVLVGSIYHAIKKLDKQGLIKLHSINQTGLRQRSVYQITEEGIIRYRKLISEELSRLPSLYPSSFYEGLTFLNDCSEPGAKKAIEKQLTALQEQKDILIKQIDAKKNLFQGVLPPVVDLTFQNMLDNLNLQITYVLKILAIL